jgi:hypothetical protein
MPQSGTQRNTVNNNHPVARLPDRCVGILGGDERRAVRAPGRDCRQSSGRPARSVFAKLVEKF